MEHAEIESLLGAFALDAVSADEAHEIEAHLAQCPRCRAEVLAHREVASLLSSSGGEAPAGVWEQIALTLEGEVPSDSSAFDRILPLGGRARRRRVRVAIGSIAAVAAIALGVLGFEVASLNGQVARDQNSASSGVALAAAQALAGPHQLLTLASPTHALEADVVLTTTGQAYWVSSDLTRLEGGRTYQLWGLAGGRIVSIGLLGADPHNPSSFRVAANTRQLMVTAEPEGGTVAPSGAVLLSAIVPRS